MSLSLPRLITETGWRESSEYVVTISLILRRVRSTASKTFRLIFVAGNEYCRTSQTCCSWAFSMLHIVLLVTWMRNLTQGCVVRPPDIKVAAMLDKATAMVTCYCCLPSFYLFLLEHWQRLLCCCLYSDMKQNHYKVLLSGPYHLKMVRGRRQFRFAP